MIPSLDLLALKPQFVVTSVSSSLFKIVSLKKIDRQPLRRINLIYQRDGFKYTLIKV